MVHIKKNLKKKCISFAKRDPFEGSLQVERTEMKGETELEAVLPYISTHPSLTFYNFNSYKQAFLTPGAMEADPLYLYLFSSTPVKSGWQLLLRPCQDLLLSET